VPDGRPDRALDALIVVFGATVARGALVDLTARARQKARLRVYADDQSASTRPNASYAVQISARDAESLNSDGFGTVSGVEQSLPTCQSPGRCAGPQSEMRESALDHRRPQDRRDDLQLAGKLPAVSDGCWPIADMMRCPLQSEPATHDGTGALVAY
jgi:hypothetical protein